MGCWNETCVVSNLPVTVGEPCEAVVLVEMPYPGEGCGITTNYAPAAILHGTYDDCGGLDNVENEEEVMEFLSQLPGLSYIYKNEKGELIPYKPPAFTTFHEFIRIVDGGLYVTQIAEFVPATKTGLEIRIVFLKSGILNLAKTIESWGKNPLDKIAETKAAVDRYHRDADKGAAKTAVWIIWCVLSEAYVNPIVRNSFSMLWMNNSELAEIMARKLVQAGMLMDNLRKAWHIPSGKGSQRTVGAIHDKFFEFCLEEVHRLKYED